MALRTVGFVGTGRVVEENYLGALSAAGVRMLLYDLDGERARRLATGPFVRVVDRLDQLDDADVVVVATPARTHATVVQRLLQETTVRVLLEKPPVTSSDDLSALQINDQDKRVSTTWIRRAFPATLLAQRWLEELGTEGPVQNVEIWEGTAHTWRSQGAVNGVAGLDPLVWDELAHPLDLVFRFLGNGPWAVATSSTSRSDQLAVVSTSTLSGPDGPVGLTVHATREESYAGVVRLRGTFGALTLFSGLNGWARLRAPGGEVRVRRPEVSTPLDQIILGSVGMGPPSAAVGLLEEWSAPLQVAEAIGTTG